MLGPGTVAFLCDNSVFIPSVLQIESLGELSDSDQPVNSVIISDCGELPSVYDYRSTPSLMAAGWPVWSEDQGPPPEGVREVQFRLDIATALKEAGNEAYLKVSDVDILTQWALVYMLT